MSRWIVRWEDQSGDDDRYVTRSHDSGNETLDDVRVLLNLATCFTDDPDGGEEIEANEAFTVWCRESYDADPLGVIEAMRTGETIKFETEDGLLEIIRERGPFGN